MWHLPFIRRIASTAPEGRVTLITRPSTRADRLLAAEPMVAEIIYMPFARGTWRRLMELRELAGVLRRERFETVWILDKISRPAIAATLAGVPNRYGFGLGAQRRWLSGGGTLDPSLAKAHQIDKLHAFLTAMDLPPADTAEPLAVVPAAAEAVGQRFGVQPKPWIVLGIDTTDAARAWPPGHFAELARKLAASTGGTVFLLGGPNSTELADDLRRQAGAERIVNACDLRMDEAAALMARADMVIGNDSGPLNVAASVGTISFGLYGTSDPPPHTSCLHAIRPDRPDGDGTSGMARITPDGVLAAIGPWIPAVPVGGAGQ